MQKLVYVMLILFVGAMSTACSDVCEKATDVLENDCGVEIPEPSDDVEVEVAECTGDVEASAQCAVDNKDAFCESLESRIDGWAIGA